MDYSNSSTYSLNSSWSISYKVRNTGSAEKAIFEQLGNYPQSLGISAGLLFSMGAIMPGIPFIPFAIVASICGAGAYFIRKNKLTGGNKQKILHKHQKKQKASSEKNIMQALQIDMVQ